MKVWRAMLALVVVIVIVSVLYAAQTLRNGFSARDQPSRLEAAVARVIRRMSIPKSAKEKINPWGARATPEVMTTAQTHWAAHCATCHANDGSGNTEMGRNLYPKAPDMRLAATQDLSDGELYYIIRNGVRLTGMPAWGDSKLKQDDESWQLVLFIRHLPDMTVEEADEMRALNPRTDTDRAEEQREQEFLNGGELPEQVLGEQHHH